MSPFGYIGKKETSGIHSIKLCVCIIPTKANYRLKLLQSNISISLEFPLIALVIVPIRLSGTNVDRRH